jgi:hypothetical protein
VDAREHRAKARELRHKARTVNDPRTRAHLLVMAAQYYWFAGWIEAQAPHARATIARQKKSPAER